MEKADGKSDTCGLHTEKDIWSVGTTKKLWKNF